MIKEFLKKLADNSNHGSLAARFRRDRAEVLKRFLKQCPLPLRILDVGGTEDFWVKSQLHTLPNTHITLLNLRKPSVSHPNFIGVQGDARNLSQFSDHSFDVVFSNSVIEHVGDFSDQEAMAREVQRVGRRFFIQTPARSFPVEPHFLFPFFAVLPDAVREWLVMHFDLGWYNKIPDRQAAREFLKHFQLLDEAKLRKLFPGAAFEFEVVCGFTKSYMVLG